MIKTKEQLYEYLIKKHIADMKVKFLVELNKKDLNISQLAKAVGCSLPLVSFHANGVGAKKIPGLLELGLLERVMDDRGMFLHFRITQLGKDVLKVVESHL